MYCPAHTPSPEEILAMEVARPASESEGSDSGSEMDLEEAAAPRAEGLDCAPDHAPPERELQQEAPEVHTVEVFPELSEYAHRQAVMVQTPEGTWDLGVVVRPGESVLQVGRAPK